MSQLAVYQAKQKSIFLEGSELDKKKKSGAFGPGFTLQI